MHSLRHFLHIYILTYFNGQRSIPSLLPYPHITAYGWLCPPSFTPSRPVSPAHPHVNSLASVREERERKEQQRWLTVRKMLPTSTSVTSPTRCMSFAPMRPQASHFCVRTYTHTPTPTHSEGLAVQDLSKLDVNTLTPLTPEVISRQATINIGMCHRRPPLIVLSRTHPCRYHRSRCARKVYRREGHLRCQDCEVQA